MLINVDQEYFPFSFSNFDYLPVCLEFWTISGNMKRFPHVFPIQEHLQVGVIPARHFHEFFHKFLGRFVGAAPWTPAPEPHGASWRLGNRSGAWRFVAWMNEVHVVQLWRYQEVVTF